MAKIFLILSKNQFYINMKKYSEAELILMLLELLFLVVAVNGEVKSQKTKWRRFEGRGLVSLATGSLVQETRDRSSCMSRCASLSECSGFSFRESERKCTLSLCGRIKMVTDPLGDLYLKGFDLFIFISLKLNHPANKYSGPLNNFIIFWATHIEKE